MREMVLRRIGARESELTNQLNEDKGRKGLAAHLSAKRARADDERFVTGLERLARPHEEIRVPFGMTGFHGRETGAPGEKGNRAIHHFGDFERVAMAGENRPQLRMASLRKPFTKVAVRHSDHRFDHRLDHSDNAASDDAAEAPAWLDEA